MTTTAKLLDDIDSARSALRRYRHGVLWIAAGMAFGFAMLATGFTIGTLSAMYGVDLAEGPGLLAVAGFLVMIAGVPGLAIWRWECSEKEKVGYAQIVTSTPHAVLHRAEAAYRQHLSEVSS